MRIFFSCFLFFLFHFFFPIKNLGSKKNFIYQDKVEINKVPFLESIFKIQERAFRLDFSIKIKKSLHSINFDGIIWYYPKTKSLRVLLKDILTNEVILDLLKISSTYEIYLFKGDIYYLNQDYFSIKIDQIEIPSKYFIPFLEQKKLFISPIETILKYQYEDKIRYVLKNSTETQFLEHFVHKDYVDNVTFFINDKKILNLNYSKYKLIENIPFSKKVYLDYFPENYSMNFYFYNIMFDFKLTKNIFKIGNYPDANLKYLLKK